MVAFGPGWHVSLTEWISLIIIWLFWAWVIVWAFSP